MNKMRMWMVGLTIVGLLAVGLVAMAGNGFGAGSNGPSAQATCSGDLNERDADGDGIPNSEDTDWAAPEDGTGYGIGRGIGGLRHGDGPMDGTGRNNDGQRLGSGSGSGNQHGRGPTDGSGNGTCR